MKRFFAILIIVVLLLSVSAMAISNPNNSFTDEERIYPFWMQDTMYSEYVAFVETEDGIYGNTLFVPSEIICVTDSGNQKEYIPDVDFKWIEGTNRIEWINGSSIPYFFEGAVNGKKSPFSDELVSTDPAHSDEGRWRIGNTLVCSGEFLYSRQFCVTYKYDTEQVDKQGIITTNYQGDKLIRTEKKLEKGEDLNILFYGDSIFVGCEASSMIGREPNMPILSELIRAELQRKTTGTVKMNNIAQGGWTTQQGFDALCGNVGGVDYSDSYDGYDLLILSFGMNDIITPVENVKEAYENIISTIREKNPNIDVILVSSMCPNPDSGFYGNQQYFGAMLKSIADSDSHIAFVDMFSVHSSILKYKSFVSTTGNGINHPNDWLIRVYGQNILSAVVDYTDEAVNEPVNAQTSFFMHIIEFIQSIFNAVFRIFVR